MTETKKPVQRSSPYPPLNVPLGQVYVAKEAIEALVVAGTSLNEVLAIHAEGYGGDFDIEESFENRATVESGGDNHSLYTVADDMTLHVHTPWHRQATVVSLHTEAD